MTVSDREAERWQVARAAFEAIVRHARAEQPRECCGLLLGGDGAISDVRPAANLADSPHRRFLLDPQAHVAALRDARRSGQQVVGFYHSHPHSAPVPSPRDLAEASYPDLLHAIVSLAGEPPEVRLYRLDRDRYQEVALTTAAEGPAER